MGRNALIHVENSKDYCHSSIAIIMDTSVTDLAILRLIVSQQLKVFLFPYATNIFEVAAEVRVVPGLNSWWSSNWLNIHALSRL